MPVIIGYLIGKMIGNFIVAIIKILFALLRFAVILAVQLTKYAFLTAQYIIDKIWKGGRYAIEYYKLNIK